MKSLWLNLWQGSNDLLLVLGMIGILLVLFTPIPPGVLDFLLLTNVSIALLILLVTFYTDKPLGFSTFPSLLLMTTLFRLALNVSATRLILNQGNAGKVINAIGTYVVGGNYVVGLVVFLILIVVQYVVVTNGAQRVAEVAARFTLDSLPGKQMSIDADLNMGIIDQEEAKRRRSQLERESNFYGAMDGASKFVKGDAIAGIIIIMINIVGGLTIGIAQNHMSWADALHRYTLLTVGDGIVTQIPSLVIAVGSGIIITRAATDARLGQEITKQIAANPKTLAIVALALIGLGFMPGLPLLPIAILTLAMAGMAFLAIRKRAVDTTKPVSDEVAEETQKTETLYELMNIEAFEIQLGSGLATHFLAASASLETRVENLRKQFAKDYGFALPRLHASAQASLAPNEYVIVIHGVPAARGELEPQLLLAINPGGERPRFEGRETREPTYGLPAQWLAPHLRQQARAAGYTLVEPDSVLLTHLSELARKHAADFLTRAETERLIDARKQELGALIDELFPTVLSFSDVQRVLQGLLREQVSIRPLPGILEVLADAGRHTKNPDELVERAREHLGSFICDRLSDDNQQLHVLTIAPELERNMMQSLRQRETGLLLPPGDIDRFIVKVAQLSEQLLLRNTQPVLLCAAPLRRALRHLLWRAVPHIHILAVSEVVTHARVLSAGVVELDGQRSLESA